MLVDVVIVTYESGAEIDACLTSISAGANVVVVDNASTDRSAIIASARGATVVQNTTNIGFAAAANQGAAAGHAPFVLFLNPDATLEPGTLQALHDELERDPTLAAVGPRIRTRVSDWQRPGWPFPAAWRSWIEAAGLHRVVKRPPDDFVVGACLLVRRSAFEAVRGFDEEFWLYGEEADLQMRLGALGWGVRVVGDATASHVGGASSAHIADVAFEQFQLGTERFLLKHRGRVALLSHRLALLAGSSLRVIALSAVGRGSSDVAQHRRRIVRRLGRVLADNPTGVRSDARSDRHDLEIVLLSLEAWDEVWRRNQLLVRELLKDPQVRLLFVEPPIDATHHLFNAHSWPPRSTLRLEAQERMVVFRPRRWLPRSLTRLSAWERRRALRRAMRSTGFVKPVLWINDPGYADLADAALPVLYDVTDDLTVATDTPRGRRRITRWDLRLTRRADRVVVCSARLQQSHGGRTAALIPNAVDGEGFRAPMARPDNLRDPPVAAYIGTLHEDRLDVALVIELARALPRVNVVLIGPDSLTSASRSELNAQPNIQLLGPCPHTRVPAYMQHADVMIIPHVVSTFTESLDPIKVYESLAVGTPTVATPVAGFRGLGAPVSVVERAAFVEEVAEQLRVPRPRRPQPVPSWADRALEFRSVLDAAISSRDGNLGERVLSVVYLDHCAKLSGAELALARLLPALNVRSHVILGEDGPLVARLELEGVSVEVLPIESIVRDVRRDDVTARRLSPRAILSVARHVWVLSRRLRELEPDLVHTNSLKAALYGSAAARIARLPVVIHIRDRVEIDYLPRSAVRLVRLLVRVVPDAVVANSESTFETLHLDRDRAAVLPSPVVYDPVNPRQRDRHGGDGPFVVGMIGRIAPWKGQDVFLRAFATAFPDGEERAVIVGAALFGEDSYFDDLRWLSKDLGLEARVDFRGFVEDVGTELDEMDALVHASVIPEPFGQVVIEGLAAGVPVIASAEGGPAEVLTNGENGLLVPPNDVRGLAAAMRRLRNDPELAARLAEAGRVRSADFSPSRIASAVLTLYQDVLTRRKRA